jgi:hypothetical protein
MTCRRVTAWLDSGMPPGEAAAVLEHAAGCAECTTRVAAARELEAWLGQEPVAMGPEFTAGVMARVAATRPQPVLLPRSPVAWWVRAVADPACALALVASALLVWGFHRLPELERAIESGKRAILATLEARAPRLLDEAIWSAVVLSVGPTLILASIALYRWAVRQANAGALAAGRR